MLFRSGALDVALSGLTIVLGIGLAAFAARSIVAASGPARTVRWPLLASGILVGAVEGMYAAVVLVEHRETAYDFSLQALFFARVAGMVGLSVAVISTSLRASRVAASVTRLGADISAAPTSGTLQASLSRSLHDPDLRVAYPRPDRKSTRLNSSHERLSRMPSSA